MTANGPRNTVSTPALAQCVVGEFQISTEILLRCSYHLIGIVSIHRKSRLSREPGVALPQHTKRSVKPIYYLCHSVVLTADFFPWVQYLVFVKRTTSPNLSRGLSHLQIPIIYLVSKLFERTITSPNVSPFFGTNFHCWDAAASERNDGFCRLKLK